LSHPYLFSSSSVFVASADLSAMLDTIHAIEAAANTELYRAAVLSHAPPIARIDSGTRGVFMGYDFHITPDGPRLIEVNTNAGGAFLNAALKRAQIACCAAVADAYLPESPEVEATLIGMFQQEWRLAGRSTSLRRLAIVDDVPETQYLYPEFQLAKALLTRHGIDAVISAPEELSLSNGALTYKSQPIDFVYNRLTDFAFEFPAHSVLREAYLANAAAVSPASFHHALYANKRNLVILSDPSFVAQLGITPDLAAGLARIPRTLIVTPENAEELWKERRHYFFKPLSGFGSKAVYRGDKLTLSTWAHIQAGSYVAQALMPPGERMTSRGEKPQKMDVRVYTYDGRPLLVAARLYQGQTTNFRTPGGGFAPVIVS
jgi:glutathione synthase/RimK-type ligase-like ATP-grasp enzyme